MASANILGLESLSYYYFLDMTNLCLLHECLGMDLVKSGVSCVHLSDL